MLLARKTPFLGAFAASIALAGPAYADDAPQPADNAAADNAAAVQQAQQAPAIPNNPAVSVPESANEPVILSVPGEDVTLSVPSVGKGEQEGNATVFDGPGADTQIAVEPTKTGVRALAHIGGRDAPERYAYEVGGGAKALEPQEDGTVLVIGGGGEVIAWVQAPWAIDANGGAVPTRFEVDGISMVQVVDHRSGDYAYPIVADPSTAPNCVTFTGPNFWGTVKVTNRCRTGRRVKAVRRAMVDTTCNFLSRGEQWSFWTVAGLDRLENC